MIGVPAFNEEKNIGNLLDFLLRDVPEEVKAIYVISSGSVDKTNKVVTSYSEDPRVHLISESSRRGKACALNVLFEEAEKYDAVVLLGADNLPRSGSIKLLINALKKEKADIVGSRPVPVNGGENIIDFCVHLLWDLHHKLSLDNPKISGELMAFRTGIIREIPSIVVNDDAYIQLFFQINDCKVVYCPEAIVYLKGPSTIRDFFKQRRRIFTGYYQLQYLLGKTPSTVRWPGWKCLLKVTSYRRIKAFVYTFIFVCLQGLSFLFSTWDFLSQKIPYKWEIIESTKSLSEKTTRIR
jgi:biofilm PGA synthesis N-glycosyltransferase PgaC